MFRSCIVAFVVIALYAGNTRAADAWKPLQPAIAASFVTFDQAGTVYVIDTVSQVYFLEKDSTEWKPLLKSKKIKYLSVSPEGTITALDKTEPYGYVRAAGGPWESKPMNLQALVYTKGGSRCLLSTDGRVLFDGKMLTGTFIDICATQKADGIYLLSLDHTLMRYSSGDLSPQTVKGSGGVSDMAGSGYGTKGGHFILDNTANHTLHYYDPSYAYGWLKLETPVPFTAIAMSPAGDLYGIGTDHRVYIFGAGQ